MKSYAPENKRGYRYVLVVIDNFSELGWTLILKYKNSQKVKDSSEKILINSKRSPNLVETQRGKELLSEAFTDFLNEIINKVYSRSASSGAVFAERFNRTIRDLLKRPVFLKRDGNWILLLSTLTKQYNKRIHSSNQLSPLQASLNKNKRDACKNLIDKRNKIKPKYKIHGLVRRADTKRSFSKGDTTNWSHKVY